MTYNISITAPPSKNTSTFAAGNIMENAVFVKKFRNYKIPLDTRYDSTDIRGIDENIYMQYLYGGALCPGWSVQNSAWFKFVAGIDSAVFNVYQDNCVYHTGIQMIVLENTGCYQYRAVSECSSKGNDSSFTITARKLEHGKTYYVYLDGCKYFETGATEYCDVTINPVSGIVDVDAVSQKSGTGIDSICQGQSVKLLASSINANKFRWSPKEFLSSDTIADPVAAPLNTTTYYVTITNEDDDQNLDSVVIYVGKGFQINSITSHDDSCKTNNGSISVHISGSSKTYYYSWIEGSTYFMLKNNSTINYLPSGSYIITVTDEYSCSNKATVYVDEHCDTIHPFELKIPNVFTPNNDGINDEFKIIYEGTIMNFYIEIFNRWGNKIFESTDLNFKWEGTNYPDGVYFYLISARDRKNKKEEYKGTLTILK